MLQIDRIYNIDCLDGLKQIENGTIDLVVTDPPYKLTSHGSSGTMSGYWKNDIAKQGKVFEHNSIELEEYIDELYRVLKDDAHCYIMCNNLNLPHYLDVITNTNFHFIKCLIWDKQTKICGKYYMGQFEYIIFLRKGKDKPINNCGCSDILSFPNKKDKMEDGTNVHDSQKPIELFKLLIENSTDKGEIVLDPFMGSGTTALASILSDRHFIGFEIDSTFHNRAIKRINEIAKDNVTFLF